jgi:hypothetical protein
MALRSGAWRAIASLLLLAGCATGAGLQGLSAGRHGDVEVEEGPEGWLKLSPLSCDAQSQDEAGRPQRSCTGRIDLNRDGVMETLIQRYALNTPSVISLHSETSLPLFQEEGYSLLVEKRRGRGGWPNVAAFGHGSTAELRVGVRHRWRDVRFEPLSGRHGRVGKSPN